MTSTGIGEVYKIDGFICHNSFNAAVILVNDISYSNIPEHSIAALAVLNSPEEVKYSYRVKSPEGDLQICPWAIITTNPIVTSSFGRKIGVLSDKEYQDVMSGVLFILDQKHYAVHSCPDYMRGCGIGGAAHSITINPFPNTIDCNSYQTAGFIQAYNEDTISTNASINGTPTTTNKTDENSTPHKKFPASSFSQKDLEQYCGGFRIDKEYFKPDLYKTFIKASQKDIDTFTADNKIPENISKAAVEYCRKKYKELTAFDARFIVTRVPSKVLCTMLKTNHTNAKMLKMMCNVTYNGTATRTPNTNNTFKPKTTSPTTASKPTINKPSTPPVETDNIPDITNEKVLRDYTPQECETILTTYRKFINEDGFKKCPMTIAKKLALVPKYRLKRAYTGKNFDKAYMTLINRTSMHIK